VGWRAVNVWNDPEALERFFARRLTAAYHAASVSPETTTQQAFEVHRLIAPELATRS
jgi:hypothetical protein